MYPVLVAEDEQWIRSSLVERIEAAGRGFKVVAEAADGETAWMTIQDLLPSIVVTDIMMPKLNGLELIERIYMQALPIIVIVTSGYDNFQYAQTAMSFEVTDYLLKPIKDEHLHTALYNSVRRLERLSEQREHLADIVRFLERMESMEQAELLRAQDELLQFILLMYRIQRGACLGLLRIWSSRINDMLAAGGEKERMLLPEQNREQICQHFRDLMLRYLQTRQFGSETSRRIRLVYEEMKRNYMKELTVSEMANQVGISVSYFSMLFKQNTGQTFVNALNRIRVERARELLLEPDLKVFEIAEMVGFESLPFFFKLFKQEVGMSPNEYRKSLGLT